MPVYPLVSQIPVMPTSHATMLNPPSSLLNQSVTVKTTVPGPVSTALVPSSVPSSTASATKLPTDPYHIGSTGIPAFTDISNCQPFLPPQLAAFDPNLPPLPPGAVPTSSLVDVSMPIMLTPPISSRSLTAVSVSSGHESPDSIYWQASSSRSKTGSEEEDWGTLGLPGAVRDDEWLASGSPRIPVLNLKTTADNSDLRKL